MGTICALHCVHHQLMWVRIILYASPTCICQRTLSSLHHDVCIIGPASWQLHCVISTISIMYKIFCYCIAPALRSYISRMPHSHGHRAYASRIILFNLINSLSKNVLEQKLTLISFLSRFTTRLRPWFSQYLGPLFFTKILLYVSTRIIHRSFPADFDGDCDLMFYPQPLAAKNEILEPLVWKNNWLVHTMAQ